jgi:hypothetical protein
VRRDEERYLMYGPVPLLSLAGVIVAVKRRVFHRLDAFLCSSIIANWPITAP